MTRRGISTGIEAAVETILAREGFLTLRQAESLSPADLEVLHHGGHADHRNARYDQLRALGDEALIVRWQHELAALADEKSRLLIGLIRQEMLAYAASPSWTAEQALALSFGYRPTNGLQDWLSQNWTLDDRLERIWRFDQLATQAGILRPENTPAKYIELVLGLEVGTIDLPPTLASAVMRRVGRQQGPREAVAERYENATQLAKRLGIHRNTVARRVEKGELPPPIESGRVKVFRSSDVDAHLSNGRYALRFKPSD